MFNKFIFSTTFIISLTTISLSSQASGNDLIEKGKQFDLSPEIIENSPLLQEWLKEIPDVLEDIKHEPNFRTRIRFGYSQFPSSNDVGGIHVGVEDIFISNSPFTISGDYQTSFNGKRESFGGDLHYYVLPLGSYVNLSPVVGYRYIETDGYNTDGVNLGARLAFVLSSQGAADVFITQSFVSVGSNQEVGMTNISAGYAIKENLRLSTDIQWQNSIQHKDSRIGIGLEWMP